MSVKEGWVRVIVGARNTGGLAGYQASYHSDIWADEKLMQGLKASNGVVDPITKKPIIKFEAAASGTSVAKSENIPVGKVNGHAADPAKMAAASGLSGASATKTVGGEPSAII